MLVLRDGGKISNIQLKPLSSKYLDSWKIINNNWNRFTMFIIYDIVKPVQQQRQQPQLKTLTTTATSKNITSIPTTVSATGSKTIPIYKNRVGITGLERNQFIR